MQHRRLCATSHMFSQTIHDRSGFLPDLKIIRGCLLLVCAPAQTINLSRCKLCFDVIQTNTFETRTAAHPKENCFY
jgi:hypothetical protein